MSGSMKIVGAFAAGAALMICVAAVCVPDDVDWRDGYVPCDTPSGATQTVGCYVDGAQPYIVTDDGETFLIDAATGQRTYVEPGHEPWVNERQADEDLIGSMPDIVLVPCPEEDSRNCYWDAARQGNGVGTSFVDIDGVTYYPAVGQ